MCRLDIRTHVHKFGGSSLVTPDAFFRVRNLLLREYEKHHPDRIVVVLSARGGLTDKLHQLARKGTGENPFQEELHNLINGQRSFARRLFSRMELSEPFLTAQLYALEMQALTEDFCRLRKSLLELHGSPEQIDTMTSFIVGFGEIWSVRMLNVLLSTCVHGSESINSRAFLFTQRYGGAKDVDYTRSKSALQSHTAYSKNKFWVVTGYISSTADGAPSTLGRNGSDYSASIVSSLLGAERLTIWSDVDGILSIDPDLNEPAVNLHTVSYDEAEELAHLGAGVLHSHTIQPLIGTRTRLVLRNSLQSESPGTEVLTKGSSSRGVATGLSSVQFLVFHCAANFQQEIELYRIRLHYLALVQEGERVIIAVEEKNAQHLLKSVNKYWRLRAEEGDSDPTVLKLNNMFSGSMAAWVRHDIGESEQDKSIWEKLIKKGNRLLVFCSANRHSLMAFYKIQSHHIPTRLLHRGVYNKQMKSRSIKSNFAQVS